MDIATIFAQSVERYPNRTALIFENDRWTYREWHERVSRFAQALSDLGVRPSDRVAFYVTTSENSVTTYFATQMLGAVAVPLNFRLAAGEVEHVLKDSGSRVLVYGRSLTETVLEVQKRLRSVHDWISCAYDVANVPPGSHHFDTLVDNAVVDERPRPLPRGDHLSALVYTSGTTGRPKGVMHSHDNDIAIAMNCVMEYGLQPTDTALHIAPLYHVGGMQAFFIPHLMVGGTNVVEGRYDAGKTLATIEMHRVTTLFAVPTQIQEMLFHPRFRDYDMSSLRMITTGGAAISASTMQQVIDDFCPNIYNGYGMTEASLTLLLRPQDALAHLGASGKPTLISQCRIVTNDSTRDVMPEETVRNGEIGQLIVRGPQAMQGYWNNPLETEQKLRHGWVYTGDLMRQDDDGFFHFHGRIDDLIVSGGENIYPREVEEVLQRCPGVRDAAVVGAPDAKWGAIVTAFIVRSDASLTPQMLSAYCKSSHDLAAFKRPRRFEFVDELPINPSGKVLKRELVARLACARLPHDA
ncbi:MAG TPA: long-chain fatty acid--CoA ligase [Casimicrobiaceae bacterium]|nr:long-chain fatty acid--CoA ligase [Casimicrobiaceae bacterium]